MKVEELNEFMFFNKRKTPKNEKVEYKIVINVKDKDGNKLKHITHSAVFSINGLKKVEIVHFQEAEGGGYDLYLNNGVESKNKPHLISTDEAIDFIISQAEKWRKNGHGNKLPNNKKGTDNKQIDIAILTKNMFPKNLKQELKFK